MKELLKKLRWKWHRDLTEGSLEELRAEIRDLRKAVLDNKGNPEPQPISAPSDRYMSDAAFEEYNRLRSLMVEIGPICARALNNARICENRNDILQYLPKGKVCAELGVMYGDYSKLILKIMEPSKFYAIDYFGFSDIWGRTDIADSHLTHQQWYEREFSKEIEEGKMEVRQGLSWDVLETFPDDYFDYIYVDAGHEYDCVSKDVEVIQRKIKNGGIIAFNDYTLCNFWVQPYELGAYYGIVPAANKLINSTNSEVLFLDLETVLTNDLVIRYWD